MTNTVQPHAKTPFPPFKLRLPEGDPIPLVCDSPHSGVRYPRDFRVAIPFEQLRSGEDTDVHALWQALPRVGATLLAAEFPRSYIDPNRDTDDIDAQMLSGPWAGAALKPTEKSRLGIGLIWRRAGQAKEVPIYDRLLSPAEVQARIDTYHRPYHAAMQEHIEAAYARFGAVWHLNLHSMPANSYESLQIQSDHPLADFVLGDRDGTTCAPEFIEMVAESIGKRGYRVAVNDPFKGVALIARLGRPAERRHSIQIEIHRGLYMNEATRERSAGFDRLQAGLGAVAGEIAAYVRAQLP
ncbi:MAG: N-formylglutamate amidohydrolase [Pseudomonadota bacterium]|nr:N-formylglutamate amidohydrolase [Pseudomonadota bacterium]